MIKFRWRAKLSFLLSGIKSALGRRKILIQIILMSLIFYSVIPNVIILLFSMMILLFSFQISINILTNRLFSSSFIGDVYYFYNLEKEKAINKIRRVATEKKDSKKDIIEREAIIKISEIFAKTSNTVNFSMDEIVETNYDPTIHEIMIDGYKHKKHNFTNGLVS